MLSAKHLDSHELPNGESTGSLGYIYPDLEDAPIPLRDLVARELLVISGRVVDPQK